MTALTWITVLLSIAMFQVAIWPEQTVFENAVSLIELLAVAIVTAISGWRWRNVATGLLPATCVAMVIVCGVLPFAVEYFLKRPFLGIGSTGELQGAQALRNIALALSACAAHRQMSALAVLASMFLALFACLMPVTPLQYLLLAAYSLAATCWLVARHWEGINAQMPRHTRRTLPKRAAATMLAAVAVLCCVSWFFARGAGATLVLRGIMPSSGGQGDYDPFARRGVFDGEQLVSAKENAFSFGPVDSEIFLDSEEPSLFDMFQDMYDEPVKKNKRSERAIALPFRQMPTAETKLATQEQSGREFEAIRVGRPKTVPQLRDLPAKHVCEVIGRTPLHLRTHLYNGWDGRTWCWRGDAGESPLRMESDGNVPWLKVGSGYALSKTVVTEPHSLRCLRYDGAIVPTPVGTTKLRIADVDRADMFRREPDSCVAMDRQRIPRMTVLHFESQLVRLPALQAMPFAVASYVDLDRGEDGTKLNALTERIVGDLPRGWRQIAAISQHVREHHSLNMATRVPADCDDAVEWFLFEAKAGPDYLFASATVELLRRAGYHARLASGFYVQPARYDERTRVTPVLAEDVHFWAEVSPDDHNWLVVESTPGYATLEPPVGILEHLGRTLAACGSWARLHAVTLATAILLLLASVWQRRRLAYFGGWLWWWAGCRGSVRRHTLNTLWLLDQRSHLSRRRRRGHEPVERWLRRELPGNSSRPTASFCRLCQWALYGADRTCPLSMEQARHVCWQMRSAEKPFISMWRSTIDLRPREGAETL